jgi:hypothetical protein
MVPKLILNIYYSEGKKDEFERTILKMCPETKKSTYIF